MGFKSGTTDSVIPNSEKKRKKLEIFEVLSILLLRSERDARESALNHVKSIEKSDQRERMPVSGARPSTRDTEHRTIPSQRYVSTHARVERATVGA